MAEDQSWAGNCFSVAVPPAECTISFCAVSEPTNLLERPQVSVSAFCGQIHIICQSHDHLNSSIRCDSTGLVCPYVGVPLEWREVLAMGLCT
jgi:hypothetical protein